MIRPGRAQRRVRDFALRLVLIAAILLALSQVFARTLVTPLLPVFVWVIEAADARYRVDSIAIDPTATASANGPPVCKKSFR